GLPVVTFNRGTKIYDVEDLIMDPERRQVLALVVDEKSAFHSAKAVPFGRINTIGPHAVIVPDGRAVIDVNRDPVLKGLYNDQVIRGLRVLSEDGRKLGQVHDMVFDDKTGEIRGYDVSVGGRLLNITQGTRWLPMDRVINIGQRIVYVPAALADEFEQEMGGLSGMLEGAGDKARTAGAKLNEQLVQAGDKVRETLPMRAGSLAVGKQAHESVSDAEGNVIIMKGDMVTEEHMERARQTGKLPQLLLATGKGLGMQGQQNFGELGTQATQSFEDIKTEARQLWGQLTGNYERTVDQADDKMIQRRIKNALGRPVTRVILDQDDNVILNTGEIITNRAIQLSREADVLDMLVDSVYTERPKLGLGDLKVNRPGQAAPDTAPDSQSENAGVNMGNRRGKGR
ncbi:MAG: PRC-barrel domain-containing protein, partial [Chloroflexia bacterium]